MRLASSSRDRARFVQAVCRVPRHRVRSPPEGGDRVDDPGVAERTRAQPRTHLEVLHEGRPTGIRHGRVAVEAAAVLAAAAQGDPVAQQQPAALGDVDVQVAGDLGAVGDDEGLAGPGEGGARRARAARRRPRSPSPRPW